MNGWSMRLVTVEQIVSSSTDENTGTEVLVWGPLVAFEGSPEEAEKFWAWFRDIRPGRERSDSGLVLATNRAELRLRWRGDITAAMRVTVHGDSDVAYKIIGGPAEVAGRKKLVELLIERYSS